MATDNLLTSLQLQGYKTFANKTEFLFPGKITAIVGPNGSGKSNIADSIRWVLGEQAYSLLRGKKTIDMIFSGSEERSRASMASASITFDNAEGWLPIDYTEVNLTRRAYRNGENEYLINDQRVRLKEINELLASSGLAERNYTIIGQGLVDSALSIKPEDRRSFFEEAAGIGLYKSRRHEANQKLDKTLRNVERVQDILRELKPRIRSLEKQQEKAITYAQLEKDLHILLKDWYGYHWRKLQDDLRSAIAFNADQKKKLDQQLEVRSRLEDQLQESQNTLSEKRAHLSNLHRELSRLHIEKEENARQLAVLEERKKAQQNRLYETEKTLSESQQVRQGLQEDISQLSQKQVDDQKELKGLQQELLQAQEQLETRIDQRSSINTEIYQKENQRNTLKQDLLRLETLVEGLRSQINVQKNEVSRLEKFTSETKREFQVKAEELSGLMADLERITGEKNEKKLVLEDKTNNLRIANNSIADRQNEVQKIERILQKLNSDFRLIIEAEESMAGFSSGAKEIMTAVKNGHLNGDFTLIMDYLQVEKEYETAIAAALGATVEAIMAGSEVDLARALNFINVKEAPRTRFIWGTGTGEDQGTADNEGIYERAIDKVVAPLESKNPLHGLLSRILIVDNFQQAINLYADKPNNCLLVTKNGEVFSQNNIVTAGKESRVRTISRKREKSEIQVEINKTDSLHSEVNLALEALQKDKFNFAKEIEDVELSLNNLNSESNRLSLAIHKLQIEQDQRQKRIEEDGIRFENNKLEIRQSEEEILKLTEKKSECQTQLDGINREIEKLYSDLSDLPVEDQRSKVTHLSSAIAVEEKVSENNRTILAEKEERLFDLENTLTDASNRVNAIRTEISDLSKEIEACLRASREIAEKIDDLNRRTQPLEKEVEGSISNQTEFLEKVDASRRDFAIAERHKMQSQMKVDRLRERLEDLQTKIGEDFGIIVEDKVEDSFGPKPLPIEGVVSSLPEVDLLPENLADQISQKKTMLRRMGPVNPTARDEYQEVSERFEFLTEQLEDLNKAENDLRKIIKELDVLMEREFLKTFHKVETEFESIFSQLFNGGTAKLVIEEAESILDAGIEIEATLPGRRRQELALLSGGERSLTAVALIFALLKISPTPFCIMDEVDAMLDESNVMRFGELLQELSDTTQSIIITHNRNTVQLADIIYGVTMGTDSVSQLISLKLDELTDEMVH